MRRRVNTGWKTRAAAASKTRGICYRFLVFALLWACHAFNAQGSGKGAGVSIDLEPNELSWLLSHPVIRYSTDPSWPPFSIRSGNEVEGLDRDFIDLFASRLGVRFDYVPTDSWDETLAKLKDGKIDFVSGLADLPERSIEVLYTEPYASFPVVMIMRNDGPFFSSLDQIERKGLTLAAPLGYAPTLFVDRNYPGVKLVKTRTSLEALQTVSAGGADVMVENLGVAAHLIRLNGLGNLKITGPTPHHFDPAFGVRDDLPELRGILNKALHSVSSEEHLRIFEKWVLIDISRMWDWRKVATAGVALLGLAVAIIGVIAGWNRRLELELQKRRDAEDSLRRSEERFRHLFETMDDAYFLTKTDGKIQFVNETAVEMLKIGFRPVVERLNIETFLKRHNELAHLLALLRAGGRLRDQFVEFSRIDGSICRCYCHVRLLKGPEENEVGIEWRAREEQPAGGMSSLAG